LHFLRQCHATLYLKRVKINWIKAGWDILCIVLVLVCLLDEFVRLIFLFLCKHAFPLHFLFFLFLEEKVEWIEAGWDIIGVIFMIIHGHKRIIKVNNVIGIILVISHLEMCMVVLVMMLSGMSHLCVVALEIFMEKTVIITIWIELGVMEDFMIVTYSRHVFWSINNIWIKR